MKEAETLDQPEGGGWPPEPPVSDHVAGGISGLPPGGGRVSSGWK